VLVQIFALGAFGVAAPRVLEGDTRTFSLGYAAAQGALTLFYGIDLNSATGFAIVYWFVAFAPVTAIGFALFAASPKRPSESLTDLSHPSGEE